MEGRETNVSVCQRLMQAPGIAKAPVHALDLFLLRDFLTASECAGLVALIDAARKPSRLFANNPDQDFRTSETCNLDPKNALVKAVDTRLTLFLGIDAAFGEFLQGQRYAIGQQFKPHHDFLRTDEPYWPAQDKRGGQRTWTAMIYLNAPQEGGETVFPRVRLKLVPRPGSLVVWNNLDASGKPNVLSLHQGKAVTAGIKHIVTKWYRERPWGPAASAHR